MEDVAVVHSLMVGLTLVVDVLVVGGVLVVNTLAKEMLLLALVLYVLGPVG